MKQSSITLTTICLAHFFLLSILTAQDRPTESPRVHTDVLTIAPIFVPFGTVNMEYDHRFDGSPVALGISAWFEFADIRDNWIHARLLYHPAAEGFGGFSFGLTAGVHRSYSDDTAKAEQDTAPVAGAIAQYNWTLDDEERIIIGTGFGMELPLSKWKSNSPIPNVNGNLRLVLGWVL